MLKTTLDLSPEDLRLLNRLYFQAYLFARYFDKITIDDERGRFSLKPLSDDEVHASDKLRHRAFRAMHETFSALPADHPDVIDNLDDSELWTPYPDDIPLIDELLNS